MLMTYWCQLLFPTNRFAPIEIAIAIDHVPNPSEAYLRGGFFSTLSSI